MIYTKDATRFLMSQLELYKIWKREEIFIDEETTSYLDLLTEAITGQSLDKLKESFMFLGKVLTRTQEPKERVSDKDSSPLENIILKGIHVCFLRNDKEFEAPWFRTQLLAGIRTVFKMSIVDVIDQDHDLFRVFLDRLTEKNLTYDTFFVWFQFIQHQHRVLTQNSTGTECKIIDNEGREIAVNGVKFGMDDIRHIVHGLIGEIDDIRKQLLTGITPVTPEQMFKRMQEDYGRIKHENLPGLLGLRLKWTQEMFLKFRTKHLNDATPADFKRLLERLQSINLKLFLMIALTCGSPYRLAELRLLLIAPASDSVERNVSIVGDKVELFTRYRKQISLQTKLTPINKYLPTNVSQYLAYYIGVIRPLEMNIAEILGETVEHASITDVDEYRDEATDEDEDLISVDDRQDLMTQYNIFLFVGPNGLRSPSQIGDEIARLMGKHSTYPFSTRYRTIRQGLAFFTHHFIGKSRLKDYMTNIVDRAAHHTSRTYEDNYGVDSRDQNASEFIARAEASNIWHDLIMLNSNDYTETPKKALVIDGKINLGHIKAKGRAKYGPTFDFTCEEQKDAIQEVLRSTDLLICMPTGMGKSETFILPCLCEKDSPADYVTIVITPFVALQANLIIRLRNKGLAVSKFENYIPKHHFDVLVIGLEKLISPRFLDYLHWATSPNSNTYIRRFVIDESHVCVNDMYRFRRGLMLFAMFPMVPVVLLSATLPKSLSKQVRQTFNREPYRIESSHLIRKNIEYIQGKDPMLEGIQKLVDEANKKNKMIIFVPTKGFMKDIDETLNWEGKSRSTFDGDVWADNKSILIQEFEDGLIDVMIATTALIAGVDIKGINTIVFAGAVNSVLDVIQGSGRCAREPGAVGKCYFYLDKRIQSASRKPEDIQSNKAFREDCCKIQLMNSYLKRPKNVRDCAKEGALLCSYCQELKHKYGGVPSQTAPRPTQEETPDNSAFDSDTDIQGSESEDNPEPSTEEDHDTEVINRGNESEDEFYLSSGDVSSETEVHDTVVINQADESDDEFHSSIEEFGSELGDTEVDIQGRGQYFQDSQEAQASREPEAVIEVPATQASIQLEPDFDDEDDEEFWNEPDEIYEVPAHLQSQTINPSQVSVNSQINSQVNTQSSQVSQGTRLPSHISQNSSRNISTSNTESQERNRRQILDEENPPPKRPRHEPHRVLGVSLEDILPFQNLGIKALIGDRSLADHFDTTTDIILGREALRSELTICPHCYLPKSLLGSYVEHPSMDDPDTGEPMFKCAWQNTTNVIAFLCRYNNSGFNLDRIRSAQTPTEMLEYYKRYLFKERGYLKKWWRERIKRTPMQDRVYYTSTVLDFKAVFGFRNELQRELPELLAELQLQRTGIQPYEQAHLLKILSTIKLGHACFSWDCKRNEECTRINYCRFAVLGVLLKPKLWELVSKKMYGSHVPIVSLGHLARILEKNNDILPFLFYTNAFLRGRSIWNTQAWEYLDEVE